MSAWDTPPTSDELRAAQPDPWAPPPTAAELSTPGSAPHGPGLLDRVGRAISDTALGFAHGIASGEGPISRIVKNATIRPDELHDLDQAYQEHQGIPASVGNFVGGAYTPESAAAGQVLGFGLGAALKGLRPAANRLAASTLKGTAGEYKALSSEEVQNLGRWLLEKRAVRFGSGGKAIAGRVDAAKGVAEQTLDSVLSGLDATGHAGLDKAALRDAFLKAAVEESKYGPARSSTVEQMLKAAQEVEKDMAASGPTGTFSEGELWKRGYQAEVPYKKPWADMTPEQKAASKLAGIAKDQVEQAADTAAAGSGMADQFRAAKADFGAAATAGRMLHGAESRTMARNLMQPADKAIALAELAISHDPVKAAAAGIASRVVRPRVASSLASTADWLSGSAAPSVAAGPFIAKEAAPLVPESFFSWLRRARPSAVGADEEDR